MEHYTESLNELRSVLKQVNGRRRKRVLAFEEITQFNLPADKHCHILRDRTIDKPYRQRSHYFKKKQGLVTAALVFRYHEKQYVVIRSFVCTIKNGFSEWVWGGKLRSADPFRIPNLQPIWLPDPIELMVYSDYLQERGLKRVA